MTIQVILHDDDGRPVGIAESPNDDGEGSPIDPGGRASVTLAESAPPLSLKDLGGMIVRSKRLVAREHLPQKFDKVMALANHSDRVTLSGLPNKTKVEVIAKEFIPPPGSAEEDAGILMSTVDPAGHISPSYFGAVDDGSLQLAFSVPGDYVVRIDPFPYRSFEVQISAT